MAPGSQPTRSARSSRSSAFSMGTELRTSLVPRVERSLSAKMAGSGLASN